MGAGAGPKSYVLEGGFAQWMKDGLETRGWGPVESVPPFLSEVGGAGGTPHRYCAKQDSTGLPRGAPRPNADSYESTLKEQLRQDVWLPLTHEYRIFCWYFGACTTDKFLPPPANNF